MGPMWPMMGGSSGGTWGVMQWLGPTLAILLAFVLASAVALALWQNIGLGSQRRKTSPQDILRERYAKGEITGEQYREALVDLLKDHYVRGEVDLQEYEKRLDTLLEERRPLRNGKGPLPSSTAVGSVGSREHEGGRNG